MRQPKQALEEQWHNFTVNTTVFTHWLQGCPGKVPLLCWLGFASFVSKEVGSEPPTGDHDKPPVP